VNETNRDKQQQARRRWREVTVNAFTPEEAQALIRMHLDEVLPASSAMRRRNLNEMTNYLSVNLEQGFGVGAELIIRLEPDYAGRSENPDDTSEHAVPGRVAVEISWAGTSRNIAAAVASVALYQRLIEVGAGIEAHFAQVRIARRMTITVPEDAR